jgi:LysM repeat protein
MSAIVAEAAHRQQAEQSSHRSLTVPRRRPHLTLVPTGPDALGAGYSARPRLRLTRRGRIVVAVLLAALGALVTAGITVQLASATGEPRVITVQPGQTLWGIASRELPDLPVTDGIVELQLANSLSTSEIHVGQRLVVPTP